MTRAYNRSLYLQSLVMGACLAACGPTSPPPTDAAADASDASAMIDTGPADVPPPLPGSTEALLNEVCNGRPRTGAAVSFNYFMGNSTGALRDMATGDYEGTHLVVERPVRINRLRLQFRGMPGGKVRVHLVDDYGRSQPAVESELMEPIDVSYTVDTPIDIMLPRPVDLHPARHAWILIEHVVEPMGMALARTSGGDFRSFFRSEAAIARNRMSGNDPTFQWFPIVTMLGMAEARLEFMAEAHGETICERMGNPWFSDVAMAAGVMGGSSELNWVDVDNDGWDDLVGARSVMDRDTPMILRNRRDGTFEDIVPRTGLDAAQGRLILWGDYDGDGDQDIYVGAYKDGAGPFDPAYPSHVWLQGMDGRFTVTMNEMEVAGPTAAGAVGDCDNDGNLDLFIGQWLRQYPRNPAPDHFFRGMGMGNFAFQNMEAGIPVRPDGRPTYGIAFVDWDNDGDRDMTVANYGGNANDVWRNDGMCHFSNVARSLGFDSDGEGIAGTSFGHSWADYDNDGDLDAHETNIGHPRYDEQGTDHSRLLRNSGAPMFRFDNVTIESGILYTEGDIASAWGDYDNDGDLDLYVATTYPFQFSRLYRQDADHHFSDVTYLAGVQTEYNGRVSWSDYDRDGDLDLITGPSAGINVWRNGLTNGNHWIQVRLRQPMGNTDALGARVTVVSADGMQQMREVSGGESVWATQPSRVQHIGLGMRAGAVTLRVRWPDGMTNEYAGIAVDKQYRIVRGAMPVEVARM